MTTVHKTAYYDILINVFFTKHANMGRNYMKKIICILALFCSVFAFGQTEEELKLAQATGNRTIEGSTCVLTDMVDNGAGSYTVSFLTTNASTNAEWIWQQAFVFPAGWVVTAGQAVNQGSSGSDPVVAMTANKVTFTRDNNCGFGFQYGNGAQFLFEVTVTASGPVGGAIVAWQMEGDAWGSEPHVLSSTSYPDPVVCDDATGVVETDDIVLDAGGPAGNVPTMSEWGMIAFVALFAIAGLVYLRRK
ncbi:MAG: hypothetical protein CSA81_06310 [Acidobacteria bacterium]|nr:MAG: hypothetical protein CSA81_06310 [Acidobacteriota bacterium]